MVRAVSGLVEDGDIWDLGEILMSRKVDVRTNFYVHLVGIQTRCHEFNLTVSHKAGVLFGLDLQDLYVLQEYGETKARAVASGASKAEQLAKIGSREGHEQEFDDENHRLELKVVAVKVEMEGHGAQDEAGEKPVTEAGVEFATAKETLPALRRLHLQIGRRGLAPCRIMNSCRAS